MQTKKHLAKAGQFKHWFALQYPLLRHLRVVTQGVEISSGHEVGRREFSRRQNVGIMYNISKIEMQTS